MDPYDLDQYQEDVLLMLRAWPDIEEAMLNTAKAADWNPASDATTVAESLRRAFRVEVQQTAGTFGADLSYVLLFDVDDYSARQAAASLKSLLYVVKSAAHTRAQIQSYLAEVLIRIVPFGKPIEGEICARVMSSPAVTPGLAELPEPEPPPTNVPLVRRGLHQLTPIEAPFYDALQETGLVFAVQPRVQGDRTYRPDFIVFYGGKSIVVELDGHEGHKTREQRTHDSERELWFQEKGISVLRWTGSQVAANPRSCVDQLLKVLRGTDARP